MFRFGVSLCVLCVLAGNINTARASFSIPIPDDPRQQIVLNNGSVNFLDCPIDRLIEVFDSPTGATTTLYVLPGTELLFNPFFGFTEIRAYDSSVVNMSGGTSFSLGSFGLFSDLKPTVNMSGGIVDISELLNTNAWFTGGTVRDAIAIQPNATAYITAGSIGGVNAFGNGLNGLATVIISGGTIGDLLIGNAYGAISGGQLTGTLEVSASFGRPSKLVLSGSNFRINGSPVFGSVTRPSGRITGTLLDGTTFDTTYSLRGGGELYLTSQTVPEPTSMFLYSCGIVGTLLISVRKSSKP